MVTYRNLITEPVFECDNIWFLRVTERKAIVLRYIDGTPISGFHQPWTATFVYTGLACCHLLALQADRARATWLVAPDGRRLGDRLDELDADQLAALRGSVLSLGLDQPDSRASDGIHRIEPALLGDLFALAGIDPESLAASPALASQRALAMLGAPHRMRSLLRFVPGDRTLEFGSGWAADEPGACRAIGRSSVVRSGISLPAARCLLTLALSPADAPGEADLVGSEIAISVNGHRLARVGLHPIWQQDGATFAFWLPHELYGEAPLEIAFRHSADFMLGALRLSHVGTRSAKPPEPADVMSRFENLGDNCEFGLVQRHFGAEPVGLLRFAGLRDPHRLVRLLDDDFGRLGEAGSLGVRIIAGEYWIIDHVYGLAAHTFCLEDEISAAEVIRDNEVKIRYLTRKLREDLQDGEKILVYKRLVTQDLNEMVALHAALNRFGTVNKLLWVTEADESHAPGDVEWVGPMLLKGYVGCISLGDASEFDPQVWLLLCRNALGAFEAAARRD